MPYVTRPKGVYFDDRSGELIIHPESITVFEREAEPTGLLNHKSEPLYRVMGPIGFDPSRIHRPRQRKKKK